VAISNKKARDSHGQPRASLGMTSGYVIALYTFCVSKVKRGNLNRCKSLLCVKGGGLPKGMTEMYRFY
ncbi:MAG: hypothetical protein ACI4M5_06120, partial [Christensenellales bacterium]